MDFNITLIIIIITCLVSCLAFNDRNLKDRMLHHPYLEHKEKEYYRLLAHGFIHANWAHLFVNMFVLYGFGGYVEQEFASLFGTTTGRIFYILLYLITIVAASVHTHYKHKDNSYYRALGASGATSGILFSYILFQPWNTLIIFPIPIPIPAIIFGVLYLVYSSYASKNSRDNIGHDAHFYGAVFGFLFTLALSPSIFSEFLTKVMQNSPYW